MFSNVICFESCLKIPSTLCVSQTLTPKKCPCVTVATDVLEYDAALHRTREDHKDVKGN